MQHMPWVLDDKWNPSDSKFEVWALVWEKVSSSHLLSPLQLYREVVEKLPFLPSMQKPSQDFGAKNTLRPQDCCNRHLWKGSCRFTSLFFATFSRIEGKDREGTIKRKKGQGSFRDWERRPLATTSETQELVRRPLERVQDLATKVTRINSQLTTCRLTHLEQQLQLQQQHNSALPNPISLQPQPQPQSQSQSQLQCIQPQSPRLQPRTLAPLRPLEDAGKKLPENGKKIMTELVASVAISDGRVACFCRQLSLLLVSTKCGNLLYLLL